ncbi:Ig-like domain-containing protein [Sphingomonas sp. Leaf343]|uniref:Ig-like domain-containing protein n=1 Tax=Sphingomonas sp. Leaf343 TaxID=1736345 RepID=UPI0006FBCCF0|nr:Ig-like domain-containing protein [Sphingomonas sp. Leaf343]KQR81385.1 hypothetical protein ASG07_13220 [Sphingomonas sp. Leaf343]
MAELSASDLPLTGIERRVLALLAEGHTAKTAAVELGLTENAVNERLREARRKTGVGSSRELARRLAASVSQENRDEEIGMAVAPSADQHVATDPPHRATGRWPKVLIAMSILIAVGLLAYVVVPQQTARNAPDPLLGDVAMKSFPDIDALYGKLRRETRDAGWGARTEAALLNRYGSIAGLKKLRTTCASTLCEVAGEIGDERGGKTLEQLQNYGLIRPQEMGFGLDGSFAVASGPSGKGVFVAYHHRLDTDAPTVSRSSPADGAIVPAGPITLSVTFDRPMQRDGYSFTSTDFGATPECKPKADVSADGRTFALRCSVEAGTSYAVGINYGHFRSFAARDGTPAKMSIIRFSTR